MEKMKNVNGLKGLASLLMALGIIVASCSKTDDSVLSATDTQNVNSESASDSYSDEAADVSNIAVAGVDNTLYGGRTEGEPVTNLKDLDDRLKCATVTITRSPNSSIAIPSGSMVIDFGTSGDCKDAKGVARKGKIIVTYVGKKYVPGSTITTTFDGFFRDGVKVEGIHTLTNLSQTETAKLISNPKVNAKIVGGKITFADGKFITRDQDLTREWQRVISSAGVPDPTKEKWVISKGGTASGTNKNGKTYSMIIIADLVYSRACAISNKVFIPVSGTKSVKADDKEYIVDFGSGECDNDITVKVNGVSKKITVGGDGN